MEELAAVLSAAGHDALLILAESSRDPALAPFVGPVHLGRALLVATREGSVSVGLFTDMEREEAARCGARVLEAEALGVPEGLRKGLSAADLWAAAATAAVGGAGVGPPGRLALAGHPAAGAAVAVAAHLGAAGWEVVDGDSLVRRARRRKDEAAVRSARRAAAGTCRAFRAVARTLRAAAPDGDGRLWLAGERLRAGHLREAVARALVPWGLEQPVGNIVAAGRDAGVPHSEGDSARELAAGEALVVDLFPRGELFADCTRTFCVGVAPEALRAAHEIVVAALRAAHEAARPGVRGWDLQEAACERFHAAGRPTPIHDEGTRRGYVHNLGHGVGYELHELPSFSHASGDDGVLAPGDLLTLEPGLYDPDEGWGVRVEDLVLIGEERTE
ncbi:MAG: M24 family metallopeptidase, partial [Thermoanaerobaculia bacterium]